MVDATPDPDRRPPLDDPGPSWVAVAKVVDERLKGPGGFDIRSGTKHFAAGARVYFVQGYWGMGGKKVTVVGHRRKTGRYITLDMQSRHLCAWRTEISHNPRVNRILAERGGYTFHGEHAPASKAAKREANRIVVEFVTPFGAYEALAEVNRSGFWRSPQPLLWAGPPFCIAP